MVAFVSPILPLRSKSNVRGDQAHVSQTSFSPSHLRAKRSSAGRPQYSPRHAKVWTASSSSGTADEGMSERKDSDGNEGLLPFEQLFLKGPVPGDRLVRTISTTGEVSCRAVNCTGLVSGAAKLHKTSPVATTAFGRALTSGLLLACGKKGGEQLQIEFRGSGPMRGLTVIANGVGETRGFVNNPSVEVPLRAGGQVDVPRALGKGIVSVVRSSPMARTPYTGLVTITSGEVAEDIAHYLAESEQINSALGAGVYVERDGTVSAAGGFLVELLPGATEETIELMERNVRALGPPTELIREGKTPEDIVAELMRDLNPMNVASSSPRYHCSCNLKRVERTIGLLSPDEVRKILEEQGKIEATCEFCGQIYGLSAAEVEKLLESQAESKRQAESS